LQKILNENYGTGKVSIYTNGQIKEILDVSENIGVVISPIGENLGGTKKIKIHYSKGRTHIVPMKEDD